MWQIITPGVEWLDIVLLQAVAACEGQKKASLLDKENKFPVWKVDWYFDFHLSIYLVIWGILSFPLVYFVDCFHSPFILV